jgi:hypothetical protein
MTFGEIHCARGRVMAVLVTATHAWERLVDYGTQ